MHRIRATRTMAEEPAGDVAVEAVVDLAEVDEADRAVELAGAIRIEFKRFSTIYGRSISRPIR